MPYGRNRLASRMVKTVVPTAIASAKSTDRRADHGRMFAEESQAVTQIEQPRLHGRLNPADAVARSTEACRCRHETGEIDEQPRVRMDAPALAASKLEQFGDVGFDLVATLAQRHAAKQHADDEWRAWHDARSCAAPRFDRLPHALAHPPQFLEGLDAGGGRLVVALALAAAHRRGVAQDRPDVALLLETGQRRVDRADRHAPAGVFLHVLLDGDAVRLLLEGMERQERKFLELAELVAFHSVMDEGTRR